MNEFDETMDSTNRICPYCEHEYQPEGEDFSEDSRVEECEGCGKNYHAFDSITVDHHAVPDCDLNDQDHDYLVRNVDGKNVPFCKVCGEIAPIEMWS